MFAVTTIDQALFERLRASGLRDVVLWVPTPWNPTNLERGSTLSFMLKAPIRRIGGYGTFERYENLPAGVAWARWGRATGAPSLQGMVRTARSYAER